jgi:hypothetical protein
MIFQMVVLHTITIISFTCDGACTEVVLEFYMNEELSMSVHLGLNSF